MRAVAGLLLAGLVPAGVLAAGGDLDKPAARSSPARALARPAIAPPPSWVLPAAIPPAPPGASGASSVDLLADNQSRYSAEGDTSYYAGVFKITSAQGLDDGTLQASWDPALETLTLHRYRILRDGKEIDLLGDGSKLTVVQRETDLENATLDGRLTVTMQPEDLRVGDTIDIAYSRTRRDPAMAGHSEAVAGPRDGTPFGRYRVRMIWPTSKTLRWRAAPGVIQPKLTRTAAGNELIADLTNVTTSKPPQNAPSRFSLVNAVEITEHPDWNSVSRTFAPLYLAAGKLSADSPVRAQAREIAAATADPKARAERALKTVQEQIRYVNLSMDGGGFVPAGADLTWARRFGDCKAKTVLLIAMLRELGIEARPVLVDTDDGDFVAARLPAMGAFDHVIVEARIAGRSYWMDGTRLGDERLDRLRTPNYTVGLPVVANGAALVPLVPEPVTEPTEVTSLVLDSSAGIDAPAPATGEIRFRGEVATNMRVKYDGMSQSDRETEMRKIWRKTYDFVTPTQVGTRSEETTGDFVLTMSGTARMEWQPDVGTRWYELDRSRLGWKIDIVRDGQLNQDAPFAFDYPDYWESREVIKLPNKGAGFRMQGSDPVDRTIGDLYAFHRKVAIKDGVVTMETSTRALAAELPAAKAASTRSQMSELAAAGVYIRVPNDYLATDGDIAALKDDKPAAAKAYSQRGKLRYDRGDIDGAVADQTAAVALDPNNAELHAARAHALAGKGDSKEAEVEADRALALDSRQVRAWRAKGLIAFDARRWADAEGYFSHEIEIDPKNEKSWAARGTTRLALAKYAEALADLDAALAIDPQLQAQGLRAAALSELGRGDEALAAAERAVAAQPGDLQIQALQLAVRLRFGKRGDAITNLNALIASKPTAENYVKRAALWPPDDQAKRQADIAAALKLDPRSADALLMRASQAIGDKKYAAAEADLAAAGRIQPDNSQLYSLRAQLLQAQGRVREALQLADQNVAKHPNNPVALNERCWLKATRNIQAESAVADCDAALKLSPASAAVLDSRGFAKLRLGAIDGAIADYDAALKITPRLAYSLYGRGLARLRRGDRAGGVADLASARSLDPEVEAEFASYGMNPTTQQVTGAQGSQRSP